MLSKNVNNKKCAPKFNEKKMRKILMILGFESQILALFDTSLIHQFSKFNNFLWVCWFLGKNLSNFVPPAGKLNNPYYHNPKQQQQQSYSSAVSDKSSSKEWEKTQRSNICTFTHSKTKASGTSWIMWGHWLKKMRWTVQLAHQCKARSNSTVSYLILRPW